MIYFDWKRTTGGEGISRVAGGRGWAWSGAPRPRAAKLGAGALQSSMGSP